MESMFYVLCTSLPCHIIVIFQYWDFSWRSKRVALTLALVNILLKMWAVYGCLQMGWVVRTVEVLFSVSGALIYIFSIHISPAKLLFTYVLVLDYLIVVRGVASFLAVRLWQTGAQSWVSKSVCVVMILLTLPWLLRYLRRTAGLLQQGDSPSLWRSIWLAPALPSVVVLAYTDAFDESSAGNWSSLLARLSLLACVFVVSYVLLQTLNGLQRQAALEEQARQNERILTLQRSQYARLRTHMEEIRRARHDLRQHQHVIQSFLDSGDDENLRAYLQAQTVSMPADGLRQYCRNYAVNLLLNHYAGQYIQMGIDYEFQVELPEGLKTAEPDVCVVVGNLLENAQEACAGQKEPYVRAVARLTGLHALTIIVDNTAPQPPQVGRDGALLSSKAPDRGVGTQSIRYIAQQYGGTADFRWEKGMFLASVFLNLQTDEKDSPKE